jgi:hypothetical protein
MSRDPSGASRPKRLCDTPDITPYHALDVGEYMPGPAVWCSDDHYLHIELRTGRGAELADVDELLVAVIIARNARTVKRVMASAGHGSYRRPHAGRRADVGPGQLGPAIPGGLPSQTFDVCCQNWSRGRPGLSAAASPIPGNGRQVH